MKTLLQVCKYALPLLIVLCMSFAGKQFVVWTLDQNNLTTFVKMMVAVAAVIGFLAAEEAILSAEGRHDRT